jgi:hypothetical protein
VAFDRDHSSEVALDLCIDALRAGDDWAPLLPGDEPGRSDVAGLVGVAEKLFAAAKVMPVARPSWKQATWQRLNSVFSVIRAIALYRLPYLPPLWIRPAEAC